jgi:hypothetical protein
MAIFFLVLTHFINTSPCPPGPLFRDTGTAKSLARPYYPSPGLVLKVDD